MSSARPSRWRVAPCRASRRLTAVLALALLLPLAGCCTRDDPHYNRYCPYDGRPGLLEYGENGLDAADRALDNLQERLDNMLE